ncbi:MAG: AAA family ATPase [Planctomycetaceae bacterium]
MSFSIRCNTEQMKHGSNEGRAIEVTTDNERHSLGKQLPEQSSPIIDTTTPTEHWAKSKPFSLGKWVGIDEILKQCDEQQEDWLIENWLDFGALAMLTGYPFSGKSCIVAELIAAMHAHGEFAGYSVPSAPVVLIDMENNSRTVGNRLRVATGQHDCQSLRGKLTRLVIDEEAMPLDEKKIETIVNECMECFSRDSFEKFKPLVVIDTFRSAFDCDEMDTKEVTKLLYPLQRVAQRTGAAILMLHHRPKTGSQYSGQTSIPGALDHMWMWESDPKTRKGTLSHTGTRADWQEPLAFKLDENNRNVFQGKGKQAGNSREIENLILEVVSENDGILKSKAPEMVQQMWERKELNGKPPGIIKISSIIGGMLEVGTRLTFRSGDKNAKHLHLVES